MSPPRMLGGLGGPGGPGGLGGLHYGLDQGAGALPGALASPELTLSPGGAQLSWRPPPQCEGEEPEPSRHTEVFNFLPAGRYCG